MIPTAAKMKETSSVWSEPPKSRRSSTIKAKDSVYTNNNN